MSQPKLAVQKRHVKDDEWQMIQPEAVPCLMFCSSFHISSALLMAKVIESLACETSLH